MYKRNKPAQTGFNINETKEGETIEQKVMRIMKNKEAIKDGAPKVYTERSEGVKPEYDIRADKWEAAVEATSLMANSHIDKREERKGEKTWDTMSKEEQGQFAKKFPQNPLSKNFKPDGDGGTVS